MKHKKTEHPNKRHYIRLDTVFPVQFRLVSADAKRFLSPWMLGFTADVGKGGICLTVYHVHRDIIELFLREHVLVSVEIEMPVTRGPVCALASVAWAKELPGQTNAVQVGLRFVEIDAGQGARIMRFARSKQLFVPALIAAIFLLAASAVIGAYKNMQLTSGTVALSNQLKKTMHEAGAAKKRVREILGERGRLKAQIDALQVRLAGLDREMAASKEQTKKTAELNSSIMRLMQEKTDLEQQLAALQEKEASVSAEFQRADKQQAALEKSSLDKMYQWLKVHQNPHTGLVMSFEGDKNLDGWAFMYDQSLAAQAYTIFSDFERAKKIFDFFDKKAKRLDGRFVNAYYAHDGSPAEYTVHVGPNVWLGIAIVQYTHKSNDRSYLALAEDIAQSVMFLQNQDPEGGIRGGPGVSWYSTEHNLDAYAFFNMLYRVTSKKEYALARDKVLAWIVAHTYDSVDVPVRRGKGDSTIATDTYAWSIAAIGPEKLEELSMDPERIIQFAEDHCSVETTFARPDGVAVRIKGFDFAAQRNVARGGVVSPEWTSQMVVSYKLMADYFYKKGDSAKARSYESKADEYLSQLANMIICSPSPSGQGDWCLPYASQEAADTGHGWQTPRGASTGSVAGTAYMLFAYYSFNPLAISD